MSGVERVGRADAARWRLLIDGPASGAWQMALDEVLLGTAANRGLPTLRFYTWSEPTLSLGYFQGYSQRGEHSASQPCSLVRRQTGGGAILHDIELTYSLALPVAHPLGASSARLYDVAHEAIVAVLASHGIRAMHVKTAAKPPARESFLCFQRIAVGDVVIGETKICGSAQRRRHGAILQHGSLLLARSEFAPELPGIQELANKKLQFQSVAESVADEIAGRAEACLVKDQLSNLEIDETRALALEKYSAASWNRRRE